MIDKREKAEMCALLRQFRKIPDNVDTIEWALYHYGGSEETALLRAFYNALLGVTDPIESPKNGTLNDTLKYFGVDM